MSSGVWCSFVSRRFVRTSPFILKGWSVQEELTTRPLKMKGKHCIESSVNTNPATGSHIPEDLKPQHRCGSFKSWNTFSCNLNKDCSNYTHTFLVTVGFYFSYLKPLNGNNSSLWIMHTMARSCALFHHNIFKPELSESCVWYTAFMRSDFITVVITKVTVL